MMEGATQDGHHKVFYCIFKRLHTMTVSFPVPPYTIAPRQRYRMGEA